MSDGRKQTDIAFGYFRQRPEATFRLISLLIVLALLGILIIGIEDEDRGQLLPVQFRLAQADLSELPVRIDRIRSCSCWHGPRNQAQRKYKFRVVNNTDKVINIDGGPRSVIRLLVAYPRDKSPRMTMPVSASELPRGQLGSPPDIEIPITDEIASVEASRIRGSNDFFGVPADYSVWALPATPNKLAEWIGVEEASYPTVVDKPTLLPGEQYEGQDLGHGTWTFYIPVPHRFARLFAGGWEPLLPRETYEKYVIFVGIAAFAPGRHALVDLLGFAPAPSETHSPIRALCS